MTRSRKLRLMAAIDKLQGKERTREELEGELDYLHVCGKQLGISITRSLMDDYQALVEKTGQDGGFRYGNINGVKKKKERRSKGTTNNTLQIRLF